MSTATVVKMPGTPKPWMNRFMRLALRTPVLQGMLGKAFGILTLKGARTGRTYSLPVQYFVDDGRYVVLSQTMRTWWRNLDRRPNVLFRVRGETQRCRARLARGDEARTVLERCLIANPRVAKFYGIDIDDSGVPSSGGMAALADHVVVILIAPAQPEA